MELEEWTGNFPLLKKSFIISEEIISLSSICTIIDLIEPNSAIFLDIDETLIMPKTNFIYGTTKTENFIKGLVQKYNRNTLDIIFQKMEEHYYQSKVIPVESHQTLKFLKHLHHKNVKIFGLTARNYNSPYTNQLLKNLKDLGIHFSQFQNPFEDYQVIFQNGIFFANNTNKGVVIKRFLEKFSDFTPKKIYFVDDQRKNCEDVNEILKFMNIPFISFHYRAAEENIKESEMNDQLNEILKTKKF